MSASLTVVGCGTVVPEPDRSCSAYLLEIDGRRLLLDCGPGSVRSLARVDAPWHEIDDIWISHFHTDHTGDLPALMFAMAFGLLPQRRTKPLTMWGPGGLADVLAGYASATGSHVLEPGFPLEVREVGPGVDAPVGDMRMRTLSTPHTDESLAVRFDHAGWSVTYTGDTGPEVDLGRFAADTTLLVCECSLPDDLAVDNHLSPSHVAGFAARALPECLLLTHVYPQFRAAADVPDLVRQAGYGGRIEMAREGWRMALPG